jgi:hypothetical protein
MTLEQEAVIAAIVLAPDRSVVGDAITALVRDLTTARQEIERLKVALDEKDTLYNSIEEAEREMDGLRREIAALTRQRDEARKCAEAGYYDALMPSRMVLQAELTTLRAKHRAAVEALGKYGCHKYKCNSNGTFVAEFSEAVALAAKCDCGFDAALAALTPASPDTAIKD